MIAKLFIVITILFLSCNSKKKISGIEQPTESLPQMWFSGLPDMQELEAMNIVAQKYGFQYYNLGRCVLSREMKDSIYRHNKLLVKILEIKYGEKWRSNLFAEIDSLRKL